MFYLTNQIASMALLLGAFGTTNAAEPIGSGLLFVPPVDEAALLVDSGTNCIALHRIRSTRIIAGEGIVYHMTGRNTLINRPRHGATHLERDQILLTRTHGSLLCAGDIVHLADRVPGMTTGFVALGQFEKYRSVSKK